MEVKPEVDIQEQPHGPAGGDEAQEQYATLNNLSSIISGSAPQHGVDFPNVHLNAAQVTGHTDEGEKQKSAWH